MIVSLIKSRGKRKDAAGMHDCICLHAIMPGSMTRFAGPHAWSASIRAGFSRYGIGQPLLQAIDASHPSQCVSTAVDEVEVFLRGIGTGGAIGGARPRPMPGSIGFHTDQHAPSDG